MNVMANQVQCSLSYRIGNIQKSIVNRFSHKFLSQHCLFDSGGGSGLTVHDAGQGLECTSSKGKGWVTGGSDDVLEYGSIQPNEPVQMNMRQGSLRRKEVIGTVRVSRW